MAEVEIVVGGGEGEKFIQGMKNKGKVLESGAQSHLIYDFYVKTRVVNTRGL